MAGQIKLALPHDTTFKAMDLGGTVQQKGCRIMSDPEAEMSAAKLHIALYELGNAAPVSERLRAQGPF